MRNPAKVIATLFDLEPSTIISLFKIDLKEKGQYLFHAGENGYEQKLVFNGESYDFFPIKADGFEIQGDGRLPRPKLTMSNHQGMISLRLNYFDDFINYKVTRIKTFVKYLDNVNFPKGVNPHAEPDPDATFTEDVYFVNQKTREDDNAVEFELVSVLELQNADVPARKIYSNHCPWMYRSVEGCCYNGKPIADNKNKRFVPSGYAGPQVGGEVYFSGKFATTEFAAGGNYQEWGVENTYSEGDVVKVTPFDGDSQLNPPSIYVCTHNGVQSNPKYDIQNWALDECDRTTCGCRLRFSDAATGAGGGSRYSTYSSNKDGLWTESDEGLPFGGFPGVDPYSYK